MVFCDNNYDLCKYIFPQNVLEAMPQFECFRNTTGISQCNATVQMLQKHNWNISMQCHSSNASETQLEYLNAMPQFKCFRNTTDVSQCNATVQMLQKHNWNISMQCHSPNASETQLVYLNEMPQFKFFRNTTGVSQCNARVLMLQLLSLRNNSLTW